MNWVIASESVGQEHIWRPMPREVIHWCINYDQEARISKYITQYLDHVESRGYVSSD